MQSNQVCPCESEDNLEDFVEVLARKSSDGGVRLRALVKKEIEDFSFYVQRNCDRYINEAANNKGDLISQIKAKKRRVIEDIQFMKKSVHAKIPNFDIDAFRKDPGYINKMYQCECGASPSVCRTETSETNYKKAYDYSDSSTPVLYDTESSLPIGLYENPSLLLKYKDQWDDELLQTENRLKNVNQRAEKFRSFLEDGPFTESKSSFM